MRLARSISTQLLKMHTYETKILRVNPDSISFDANDKLSVTDKATEDNLKIAAKVLVEDNDVVGFPTETVYGLGGSAICDQSVRSIFRAKNRPSDNPLIVHVSSVEQLRRKLLPPDYQLPEIYHELTKKFWPGPLTILLPIHDGSPISKLVTANQSTFGVRIPLHPVARALIAISDTPLAAPSANASTRPSPTLAEHVYHDLQGKIPYIVDGGACDVGVESTVVDGLVDPPMLLRPGGVSVEELSQIKGWSNVILGKLTAGKMEAVKTPGMKYRHYSPTAKVVLFKNCGDGRKAVNDFLKTREIKKDTKIAILRSRLFADDLIPQAIQRNLGPTGSEISHNLFRYLREVDEMGVELILVEGIDEENEGLAVMNRLKKAAMETVDGE